MANKVYYDRDSSSQYLFRAVLQNDWDSDRKCVVSRTFKPVFSSAMAKDQLNCKGLTEEQILDWMKNCLGRPDNKFLFAIKFTISDLVSILDLTNESVLDAPFSIDPNGDSVFSVQISHAPCEILSEYHVYPIDSSQDFTKCGCNEEQLHCPLKIEGCKEIFSYCPRNPSHYNIEGKITNTFLKKLKDTVGAEPRFRTGEQKSDNLSSEINDEESPEIGRP